MSNTTITRPVFITSSPSAIHFGNCFLGASYDRKEANSWKGRSGWVERFASLDAAKAAHPNWEMSIMNELEEL